MDNFNFQTVTLAGRRILRDSIVTGEDIIFTRFRIGDSAEQPDVPEVLEDVLSPRFWVPVAETRQAENGEAAVQVDGVFKQDAEHSDFYFRELGLFAKLGESGQEVMFGYLHAGEIENYIPTSDSTNLATYNFIVTIPIGSASVLVTYDPEALVSLKKYKDLELRVNKFAENYDVKMGKFETDINDEIENIRKEAEEKIKDIEDDVEEKLKNLRQSVADSIGNYVKKAGDTMTGKLTGTAAEFSGDVSAKNVTGSTAIKGGAISGTTGTFSGAVTSSSTIQGTTITATTGFKGNLTGNVSGNVTGGTLSGTTCTLTGQLTGTSADFSGVVNANNLMGSTAIKGGTISGTTCTLTGKLTGTAAEFSGTIKSKDARVDGILSAAAANGETLNFSTGGFEKLTSETCTLTGKLTGTAAEFSGDVSAKNVTGSTAIKGGAISGTTCKLTGQITGTSAYFSDTINGCQYFSSWNDFINSIPALKNIGASNVTPAQVGANIKAGTRVIAYISASYGCAWGNIDGIIEIKSAQVNELLNYSTFTYHNTSGFSATGFYRTAWTGWRQVTNAT